MMISRKLRLLIALVFFFFVAYPNPLVLVRSIEHISHPAIDPQAVAPLAAFSHRVWTRGQRRKSER